MHLEDIIVAKRELTALPSSWDGKECILEMRRVNYNWRQMEWWGFFFELQCTKLLSSQFQVPGDSYGRVQFDLKRSINWDLKAKAIKSDDHRAILNDINAVITSVENYGFHGLMIALCDVEYNDVDRSFQKWHENLKGGESKYVRERKARTSISRYRKTHATLAEVLFLIIDSTNLQHLGVMKQGRNSNGNPRAEKFMLDFNKVDHFLVDTLPFVKDYDER